MTVIGVGIRDETIVAYTPFQMKELLKSIPGRTWNKDSKCWQWPITDHSLLVLDATLPANFFRSQKFKELLAEAERRRETDIAVKTADPSTLPNPPLYTTEPWGHQRQAWNYIKDKASVMLPMDMGTGKSKVAIDYAVNRGYRRILIMCPKAMITEWATLVKRHWYGQYITAPLTTGNTGDKVRAAQAALRAVEGSDFACIISVSYGTARMDEFKQWACKQEWDLVVCDESQYIKSSGSATCQTAIAIGKHSKARMCLTGTPMHDKPVDVFGQYKFLDPTIFGTNFGQFRARYCIMGGFENRQILGYTNIEDFQRRFWSIAFPATKDMLDLPEYHHVVRTFELGQQARDYYKSLVDEAAIDMGDGNIYTVANKLVENLRLQQLTGGWLDGVQVDTGKQELLVDTLDEIAREEPVVVFARFRDDLASIRTAAGMADRAYFELSGSTNQMDLWRNYPDNHGGPVLGVQIRSGGAGVDLTKSAYAIYYSTGHSLGDYEQSIARIHRPGQTRKCTYIHLSAERTIDVIISRALRNKRSIVDEMKADPDVPIA